MIKWDTLAQENQNNSMALTTRENSSPKRGICCENETAVYVEVFRQEIVLISTGLSWQGITLHLFCQAAGGNFTRLILKVHRRCDMAVVAGAGRECCIHCRGGPRGQEENPRCGVMLRPGSQ